MARRTLLPPSSGNARRSGKALTRAVRRMPEHKSARRKRAAGKVLDFSWPMLLAGVLGALAIWKLKKP
jgi:hypothetical protein